MILSLLLTRDFQAHMKVTNNCLYNIISYLIRTKSLAHCHIHACALTGCTMAGNVHKVNVGGYGIPLLLWRLV